MNIANPFERAEIRIMEGGRTLVDSSWHRFVAFFPYYRLYYVVSGHAVIYLENKMLEMLPGMLYFIPAFSIFDANCDEILDHYWLHFNFDITTVNYLKISEPLSQVKALPLHSEIFKTLVDTFIDEQMMKTPAAPVACNGLCKYLFSLFLPQQEINSEFQSARFIPILDYIDQHLTAKISNAELAEIMYLSPTYFSNLFTKHFGISPQQYILQKRMNLAATMLFESKKNVKEIAFACGYDSEIYFNRMFNKLMGMPPGKYKRNSRPLNSK